MIGRERRKRVAASEITPDTPVRCPRCEQWLTASDFYGDRSKRSGLRSICKQCDSAKDRAYYARSEVRKRKAAEYEARAGAPAVCRCGKPLPSRRFAFCEECGRARRRERDRERDRLRYEARKQGTARIG